MKNLFFISLLLFYSCMSVEKVDKDKLISPVEPKKGDGFIFEEAIKHTNSSNDIFAKNKEEVRVIIEVRKNDVESIDLFFGENKYNMEAFSETEEKEFYFVDVPAKETKYYFELNDKKKKVVYTKSKEKREFYYSMKQHDENTDLDIYPHWADGLVWYKIYVDSFKNGSKANDKRFTTVNKGGLESSTKESEISKWNSDFSYVDEWLKKSEDRPWDEITAKRFGGDIAGIKDKLSYLNDLGVEVLELSPVFYSKSGSKFDTIDYRHISPDYGVLKQNNTYSVFSDLEKTFLVESADEVELLNKYKNGINGFGESFENSTWKWTESDILFSDMIKTAKESDMKVVADIDLRGVSTEFFMFELALIEGPASKYRDCFVFNDWNKVEEFTEENIDVWNPLVEYKGESDFEVINLDGKKYRRKWLKIEENISEELKSELLEWNKENVAYEKVNLKKIKLNYGSEMLKNYIYSSAQKWLKGFLANDTDSLDGYKVYIDDEEFYKEFKREMLAFKQDVLIINSDIEDYHFVDIMLKTIVATDENIKLSSDLLKEYLKKIKKEYSDSKTKIRQYPLDGVYTDRIYSQLINKDRAFDKLNNTIYGDDYLEIRPNIIDENVIKKLKQIIAFQIFSAGNPYIYYGTEVGMWGGDVPYNRKPMLWEENLPYEEETDRISKYEKLKNSLSGKVVFDEIQQKVYYTVELNTEIYEWYKLMLSTYKENREFLKNGEVEYIDANENDTTASDVIVQKYKYNDEELLIVLNNSQKKRTLDIEVESRKDYREVITDEKLSVVGGMIQVELSENGIAIIKK